MTYRMRHAAAALVWVGLAAPLISQEGTKSPSAQTSSSPASAANQPIAAPLSAKELREAQIAADTKKLLALAEELKVEVAKSSKDTLSLAVVRKAAEIEKLAHSLKEEMKKE